MKNVTEKKPYRYWRHFETRHTCSPKEIHILSPIQKKQTVSARSNTSCKNWGCVLRKKHDIIKYVIGPKSECRTRLCGVVLAVTLSLVVSCATTVEFTRKHPPLVDMHGIKTITVIPLEWDDEGQYRNLARNVTRALTAGVKKAHSYRFIDPAPLKNLSETELSGYVDGYIVAKIIKVDFNETSETKEEKRGDKTKEVRYTTQSVTIDIRYEYISTSDNRILRSFVKSEQASITFEDTPAKSWIETLLKRLFIALTHEDVRKTAIKRFSSDMGKELEIWTTVEKRQIQESSSDDQAFKEAEKLVRKKRYSEALLIYKKIYEQRNSFTAGYNMALMLEANHQFLEALTVLEDLEKRMPGNDVFNATLVKNEIAALNRIINELEELPH